MFLLSVYCKKDGSLYSEDGGGGWGGYDPSLSGIREYLIMHPSGIYVYPADSGTSVILCWAYDNVWVYINLIEITQSILVCESNLMLFRLQNNNNNNNNNRLPYCTLWMERKSIEEDKN